MKRKKNAENAEAASKPKKYKKKIENPEKQKFRYVYDNKGESGKVWEKKRRDRLNKTFDDLLALLPNRNAKMSKIDILSGSIKRIEELEERIKNIEIEIPSAQKDTVVMVDASCNTDCNEENKENVKPDVHETEIQCDIVPESDTKETQTEELLSKPQIDENVPLLSSSVRVTPALIPTPIMTPTLYQPQHEKTSEKNKKKAKRKDQDVREDSKIDEPKENFDKPEPSRYTIESIQNSEKCRVRKNLMAELPLPTLHDIHESELIEALAVPTINPVSNGSLSPTSAYLHSFPVLPGGKQIGDDPEEDKSRTDNLHDSNTRTMLDLENFFPSHLLANEPSVSPIVTNNKKKPTFDSPLKDNSSNKPLKLSHYPPIPKVTENDFEKKSPVKYTSNYYSIPPGDVTYSQYNQYNSSLFTTTTYSNDRYIEQPSNFTFSLTTGSKTDPKYTTTGKDNYYPHQDKKAQPAYYPTNKFNSNQNMSSKRYPFYMDSNFPEPVKTKSPHTTTTTSSCAKTAGKPDKRACPQQQFSTKYDVNWMTSTEVKSNTPDLNLISFDYLNQQTSHYTSGSLEMNRKSDLYFAHGTEENNTWSPSKMTNNLDSTHFSNQYFTPTLPNLHGDLALNLPPEKPKEQSVKKSNHETNFLSVQQLMNTNQPQKAPIRTKGERKHMPAYCDINVESRSYNYSAESLINPRPKPKTFDYHIEPPPPPTASFTDEQFYNNSAGNKCDTKVFATSFMDTTNLYQSSCFPRQPPTNFTYSQEKYSASSTYQKPYTVPQLKNPATKPQPKNKPQKYQPYDFPAQDTAYSYNHQSSSSTSAASFNYNSSKGYPFIQGSDFSNTNSISTNTTRNNISNTGIHQNQNTGGSLTNFNVSTIFPEINDKIRPNW